MHTATICAYFSHKIDFWLSGPTSAERESRDSAHSANFNEKVHKPQSKSYGSIVANMQLMFPNINLNTSISASQLFGV